MDKKGFSIILVVIILVIIVGGVLVWQYKILFPQKIFSCKKDTECVLAYTGMDACPPCDYSEDSYQCVSLKEAERLQQKRIKKHGTVACDVCGKNEVSPIAYKCVCNGNLCVKIAEKSETSD